MEGSALSERDLIRARAETAHAILLFADRFSPSARNEDLNLQFQVLRSHANCACLTNSANLMAHEACKYERRSCCMEAHALAFFAFCALCWLQSAI